MREAGGERAFRCLSCNVEPRTPVGFKCMDLHACVCVCLCPHADSHKKTHRQYGRPRVHGVRAHLPPGDTEAICSSALRPPVFPEDSSPCWNICQYFLNSGQSDNKIPFKKITFKSFSTEGFSFLHLGVLCFHGFLIRITD